jgi:predicted O-methyltransferase YrrM
MLFTDLTIYKNRKLFNDGQEQRNWIDTYALFHLLTNTKFTKVLEIGYLKGFTFSLMYDCLYPTAEYFTSCDITYINDIASSLINFKNCEFIETDSNNLILNKTYNFIIIDGKHTHQYVTKELKLCYNALEPNGIILVDDYSATAHPGVAAALDKFLLEHPEITPVLIGHQQIFLSRRPLEETVLQSIINNTKLFLTWDTVYWPATDVKIPRYQAKLESLVVKFTELIKIVDTKQI